MSANVSPEKSTAHMEHAPFVGGNTSRAENSIRSGSRPRLWTPFFTSRLCFAGFGVLYVALAVVLGALYSVSRRNKGLATSGQNLHYLWTYGPTAVLTVVASLWGQVDFRTKQLMPWRNLLHGPSPARNTLLLDYISPWVGSVLWTSLRRRNFPVFLSAAGSLLLKLLIILSTGLFTLQSLTLAREDAPLQLSNEFNGESFNHSMADVRPMAMVDSVREYENAYPFGTNERYAFQTFNSTTTMSPNTSLSAQVEAFGADFSCDVLSDQLFIHLKRVNPDFAGEYVPYIAHANATTLFNVTEHFVDIFTPDCHLRLRMFDGSRDAKAYIPNCNGRSPLDSSDYSSWKDAVAHGDHDVVFYVAKRAPDYFRRLLTVVHCRTQYGIVQANLSIDNPLNPTSHLDPSPSEGKTGRKLPGVTMLELLRGVERTSNKMPTEKGQEYHVDKGPYFLEESFFPLLKPFLPQGVDWRDAGYGSHVAKAAETSFPAIMAQIAHFNLLQPANDPFTGNNTSQEPRLTVQPISLGLMVAVLTVLLILSTTLFSLGPRAVCPRDPGSIGGLAAVLGPSKKLHESYRGTGTWDSQAIDTASDGKSYQPSVHRSETSQFTVDEVGPSTGPINSERVSMDITNWWRPMASRIPFQILVYLLPAGLIVALEVLLLQSQKSHGLVDVTSTGTHQHYAWAYIPTSVMFGVNLVYDAVDFNARIFQAYSLLRKQSIAADRGILNCQVGRWSPLNLWDGIRYGLTAVVATTVAVLVGKLLPITVSGLYTAHPGELLSPVSAAKNGSFDFGLTNFTDQESAAIMVLYTNTSYPKWTYEEFAFPTFELPTNITNLPFHEGYTVTMNTEGLRLSANCTALGKENVDLRNNQDSTGVQLNVHLPHHCNDFNKTWDFKYGYFGMANTAFPGQIVESRSFGPPPDVQGNCARWVMAAGYAQDYTLRNATVSAFFCSPYFETVETKVTLQVPSLSVGPLNPPIVHEHTAKHVASFNNKTQIPEMEDDFANAVRQATVHKEFPYAADFDEFFTAVVAGRGGTPAQELVGAHNLPRLRKAVQHTCGIIEAQHANYKFRANSTGPDTVYHGTLRNPNRVRIVQSVISTRILQALLGVMLLCGIVAYVTVETRRVLPKNPCSIGAVLSLLAGSPILTESVASPEAQWWNDDELKRNGVFQGWLVSLGWWKDGADEDRFGVGVGQAEWRK